MNPSPNGAKLDGYSIPTLVGQVAPANSHQTAMTQFTSIILYAKMMLSISYISLFV